MFAMPTRYDGVPYERHYNFFGGSSGYDGAGAVDQYPPGDAGVLRQSRDPSEAVLNRLQRFTSLVASA
jgi:hypothetical protein